MHTNCLLSAATCICLPVSYCVMVLLLNLFTPGLLSRMPYVPYLCSVLLPYCFKILRASLVANDDAAANGTLLCPWTKNIAIRNTASWSTEASVYAASLRCSSLRQCNLSSGYSHSFCQTCNFFLETCTLIFLSMQRWSFIFTLTLTIFSVLSQKHARWKNWSCAPDTLTKHGINLLKLRLPYKQMASLILLNFASM